MDTEDIKPCPFCGATDISLADGSTFRWKRAQCNSCDASTGEVRIQTSGKGTNEEWERAAWLNALKEWNTRASENIQSQNQFRSGEKIVTGLI